jgi:hypothetical protein
MSEVELLKLLEFENQIGSIYDRCFPKQREAALHPSKRKVIRCSRRAGKTELACYALIKNALAGPDGISLYIALTRKSAKRLIWGRLKRVLRELEIGFEASETELIVKLSNGSEIWLAGANQEDVAETLRGHAYRIVILDECASFRGHIDILIEEILEPATLDENGEIWIMGTPSWDFTSYFYKANHNPDGWTSFFWTLFDNPHLPNAKEFVEQIKKRRGWSDDNPSLLREYGGRWIRSHENLVYHYNPLKNLYSELPEFAYKFLGVDLGFEDKAAFSIVAHAEHSKQAFVIHSEAHHRLLPFQIAERIDELMGEHDLTSIVIDEGGLGKSIAEEYRVRYQIPCKPAKKSEKRAYIEFFNSEMHEGKIQTFEDNPVIDQWQSLPWHEDGKIEKPGVPNDYADSILYAWRESLHFLEDLPEAPPKPGSDEFYRQEEERILREKERHFIQKGREQWI